MTDVRTIKIEPLSTESFEPFGEVVGARNSPPDYRGGAASYGWVTNFEANGTPRLTISTVPFQGMTFTQLERQLNVTQTYIPLGGPPAAIAVAPPTDPRDPESLPDPAQVRAFLIDGSQGYLLKRGTWHTLGRFPLYGSASVFAIIGEERTWNACIKHHLPPGYPEKDGWKLTQEVDLEARLGVSFAMVL